MDVDARSPRARSLKPGPRRPMTREEQAVRNIARPVRWIMELAAAEDPDGTRGAPRVWSLDEPADVTMEERLRAIVRLAPIGIGIVDLDGHTVLSNDALCAMLGYTADEFAEVTFESFTHPGDVARNDELFAEMVAGRSDHFEMDKRFIHGDGHVVWGRLQVSLLRDPGGAPAYAIGMVEDVTEEKHLRAELERLAYQDPLTGLPNRRLFHDRVEQQMRRGGRSGARVTGAVLFADLDDFKLVNDSLGHHTGDEFAVLVEGVVDPDEALAIGHRLRRSITRPVQLSGRTITPSVSIGLAMLADCNDIDEVLRTADLAMYHAKELGKDRVVPYAPELSNAVARWLDVDAPRAIDTERRAAVRSAVPGSGEPGLHAVGSPPTMDGDPA